MKRFVVMMGLTCCLAYAQPDPPAFEVASIKQAAPQPMGRMSVRMGMDAGRVDYANVSLKDVLARAYNVKRYQISGPDWLDSERYDITAKVPDGVSKEQVPAMLQALLADRFRMTVRKESREEPVYGLVVAKGGPKLTKSAESEAEPPGPKEGPGKSGLPKGAMMVSIGGPGGSAHMNANKVTLTQFADMLSNILNRPVVDMTGVQGNYDFSLDVSMDDMAGMRKVVVGGPMAGPGPGDQGLAPEGAPSASIFSSLQSFGLKLESRKAPLERIVVEKAEKVPTEN